MKRTIPEYTFFTLAAAHSALGLPSVFEFRERLSDGVGECDAGRVDECAGADASALL
jgi:hypothetical protein